MAEIAKVGTPTVVSRLILAHNRIEGSRAGEDVAAGDACYINDSGEVCRATGASAGGAAEVRGFAAAGAACGAAITLVFDVTMSYGEDMPSTDGLYLSAIVPGGLADCPSPGGNRPVAFRVDATRIHVLQS